MKITAEELYRVLHDDFKIDGAHGYIRFKLREHEITVEQNNVVGNILEEWLAKWMKDKGYEFVHNHKQAAPDFWLDPDDLDNSWLEIKSFYGSPNFDVSAFRSYINAIIEHPNKLHSKYLLIKYDMVEGGEITVQNVWLKNVWEICCTSATWSIRVQYRNKTIVNIRPATWYSDNADYKPFESLEHFLAALEQTIYRYHDTNAIAETWLERVCNAYKKYYGKDLNVPRWNDIKAIYGR